MLESKPTQIKGANKFELSEKLLEVKSLEAKMEFEPIFRFLTTKIHKLVEKETIEMVLWTSSDDQDFLTYIPITKK
jgi:hypothetical protein